MSKEIPSFKKKEEKKPEKPVGDSLEEIKKKEPLCSMEEEKKKLDNFNFFFNLINNQPLFINESILRAWMEGKYDDNGYLTTIDQRGTKQRVTKLNGELIQPPSFQRTLRLDGEQAELVVELLNKKKEANTEQLTTEGKINTFSFFFNLINNQPLFINESILRAWMEGKYDDNGYLTTIDQRGTKQRVTKLNGELIQPPSFQRALRLDGEQAELVVELLKLTKGQDVPDEVKENLKKFVFQNDQRALGRMREVALMINQEALGERVEAFVTKYGRIREDLEFQKKFYDLYSKNESLSVLLA